MFFRRGSGGYNRFTPHRVAILFLAAGIWLAGVIADRAVLTGAAIVILALGLLLGFLGREKEE